MYAYVYLDSPLIFRHLDFALHLGWWIDHEMKRLQSCERSSPCPFFLVGTRDLPPCGDKWQISLVRGGRRKWGQRTVPLRKSKLYVYINIKVIWNICRDEIVQPWLTPRSSRFDAKPPSRLVQDSFLFWHRNIVALEVKIFHGPANRTYIF